MSQPWHDGIVEKWTQFVDFAMRKCGLKNNWQSRATTTHSILPTTSQELEVLLNSKERSAVKL
jgi:hypothetical protein